MQIVHRWRFLLTCTIYSFFRYQHDPELRQGHQPILLQNKARSYSSQTFRHPDSANEGVYDVAQEIDHKTQIVYQPEQTRQLM